MNQIRSIRRSIILLICAFCFVNLPGCGMQYRLDVSNAVQRLKEIRTAEEKHKQANGSYGQFVDLANSGLITQDIVDGVDGNYRFRLQITGPKYRVIAMTTRKGQEDAPRLSFFTDETGIIRATDKANVIPDEHSEAIGNQ